MSALLDTMLCWDIRKYRREKMHVPPQLYAVMENRARALGQTKPPAPPEPSGGSQDDSVMAAIKEALGK